MIDIKNLHTMKRNENFKNVERKLQDIILLNLSFIEQIISSDLPDQKDNVKLFDESIETFISETSTCLYWIHVVRKKSVCGEAWLKHFLQSLSYEEYKQYNSENCLNLVITK